MSQLLRRITKNPSINILVGIIFLATGLVETWRELDNLTIGTHHGAIFFGLLHVLKYFPDFIEGADYLQKNRATKNINI